MNTKEPQQQEPLPHMAVVLGGEIFVPQRKPLTDEEIDFLWQNTSPYYDHQDFARAIEAAHGIKE